MILTIDLGTTATKVAVWDTSGLVALGRAPVPTTRPQLGRAEQDPASWWASVVDASRAAHREAPRPFGLVEAVACCGARQTFVPVDAEGEPLGPGLLWSDCRGEQEAESLAASLGGAEAARARTGVPLDAGSVAAKVAWLATHQPRRLAAARWLLSPRDLVVSHLAGRVMTDTTMASRSGLYDLDGAPVDDLAGPAAGLLPPVVGPDTVVGPLLDGAASALGVPAGAEVVIGAGDRACEVLGAGAAPSLPMVSWGTTASVAVPVGARPAGVPDGLALTRAAGGGWLLEGGTSVAGSLLAWLADLTGRDAGELMAAAALSPPGARGVLAAPWLDGARAPWWRSGARAGLVGLGAAHDIGDIARASVESVAADVRRCLAAARPVAHRRGVDPPAGDDLPFAGLVLGGHGSTEVLWPQVVAAVTGLAVTSRRSGEAASAGAALLAASATGRPLALDSFDPKTPELVPDPEAVARYAAWRTRADRVAGVLVGLDLDTGGPPSGLE